MRSCRKCIRQPKLLLLQSTSTICTTACSCDDWVLSPERPMTHIAAERHPFYPQDQHGHCQYHAGLAGEHVCSILLYCTKFMPAAARIEGDAVARMCQVPKPGPDPSYRMKTFCCPWRSTQHSLGSTGPLLTKSVQLEGLPIHWAVAQRTLFRATLTVSATGPEGVCI